MKKKQCYTMITHYDQLVDFYRNEIEESAQELYEQKKLNEALRKEIETLKQKQTVWIYADDFQGYSNLDHDFKRLREMRKKIDESKNGTILSNYMSDIKDNE